MLRVRRDVGSYRLPRRAISQRGALVACAWWRLVRCFRPDRICSIVSEMKLVLKPIFLKTRNPDNEYFESRVIDVESLHCTHTHRHKNIYCELAYVFATIERRKFKCQHFIVLPTRTYGVNHYIRLETMKRWKFKSQNVTKM